MMKGFINKLAAVLACTAVLAGTDAVRAQGCPGCAAAGGGKCGVGCCCYRNWVDPCYPERYNYMARSEVNQAFAPQVQNGHVLDQTVWNYYFDPGTDRLNPGGLNQLAYIARRRPCPDLVVYLQTAQDVVYNPEHPEKLVNARQDLDLRRAQAVNNFLMAQTGGCRGQFQIYVHDPAEVGISAIPVSVSLRLLYYTRFRGGLLNNGQGGGGFQGARGAGIGGAGGGGMGGGGGAGMGIGGAGGPGGAAVGGAGAVGGGPNR